MSHNPYCPPHSQGLWLGPPPPNRLLAQGWESDSGLTQHDPHHTQHTPPALHASPAQLGSAKVAGPKAVDDSCLPTTSLNSSITTPPTSAANLVPFGSIPKGGRHAERCPEGPPVGGMTRRCPWGQDEPASAVSGDRTCRNVTLHWDQPPGWAFPLLTGLLVP